MINYADKAEWRRFVNEYIVPLRYSAEVIVNRREYLRRKIDELGVSGIVDNFKMFFLGEVSESPFIKFVSEVAMQTKKIENIASSKGIIEEHPTAVEHKEGDFVRKPEEVIKLVENFYNNCAKVTPNYNEHSLFILTIRTITRRYLEAAYPEFKERFEELRQFFGLEPLFTPKLEDSEMKQKYTIWHLPEGSFGGEIKKLYEIIWDYNSQLKEHLSQYFDGIVDLKKEFFEMAKNSIPSSEILYVEHLISHESELDVNDPFRINFHYKHETYDYLEHRKSIYRLRLLKVERPVTLVEVLNEISPSLFAGLINIKSISEFYIEFEPLVVK